MAATFRVIRCSQIEEWDSIIRRTCCYDFYHLGGYHLLEEQFTGAEAVLFVLENDQYLIALPLILIPANNVAGLEHVLAYDANSVYGYAGPLASRKELPAQFLTRFFEEVKDYLLSRIVATVFSRLHPLIPQHNYLQNIGEIISLGPTVSIDLQLSVAHQWSRFRRAHKYDINKLRNSGVLCIADENRRYLGDFIQIYHETMRRIGADTKYFFSDRYIRKLLKIKGVEWQILVGILDDTPICAGLFSLCSGIVQYHLSGTRTKYQKLAPTKLLLDEARLWAVRRGATVFHLGGGVGSREDSLFHFKAGFSRDRHKFSVWRWVVAPKLYSDLVKQRNCMVRKNGFRLTSNNFFPLHRCPAEPYENLPRVPER